MRTMFYVLLLLLLAFPAATIAQINVSRIEAGFKMGEKEGIVYALPRNVVRVEVMVEQKELLAGPLRNYAKEYMGIENYIAADATSYAIKDIRIITLAEPDPEQYYFISLLEKSSKQAWKTLFRLNGMGLISSIEGGGKHVAATENNLPLKVSRDEAMKIFQKNALFNIYPRVDTIVRTINIDTVTIEDYTFRTSMTAMPLELKAKEIAALIGKIRNDRYNLLTGYQEVNYSEGAVRFMSDELQELEQDYLRLFTGVAVTKQLTYSFSWLPTEKDAGSEEPLFRFSESKGITKGGSGEQATITIIPSGNTDLLNTGNTTGKGLYYRLPGQSEIVIMLNGRLLAQMNAPISQFGKIAVLPSVAYDVEFDENTGGIRSVKLDAE
ncbi:MAG: DUF4831 family protein [Bacteroidales bacterium]|nr:DUF4831 family protein [Bacteroidales bacterium]